MSIRLAATWYLQTCCKLLQQLAASLRISSCSKSVVATCSKSVERINADASCENQTCCKLIFADLLQVVSTTCSKLVDNKSWQVCRSNLQQVCWTISCIKSVKIRLAATWHFQTCCKLPTICIKLVDNKSWQVCWNNCSKNQTWCDLIFWCSFSPSYWNNLLVNNKSFQS